MGFESEEVKKEFYQNLEKDRKRKIRMNIEGNRVRYRKDNNGKGYYSIRLRRDDIIDLYEEVAKYQLDAVIFHIDEEGGRK